MREHVFALIDCASFYVSCERVFGAALHNRATIVLSNNDGCIVALDNLAKQIGLRRGQPVFKQQDLIRKHKVQMFSSNYALYADMSARVMRVLAELAPRLEIYSVDEAFADLTGMEIADRTAFAATIKSRVYQHTGLPVRVAIASTKGLTKIGCELAKANEQFGDVVDLTRLSALEMDEALARVAIEDVWGIGTKYASFLRNYGSIGTARDLKYADARWIQKYLTVVGARIQLELQGISCMPLETKRPLRQQIMNARSFGQPIITVEEMEEAVSCYVAATAEKLRKQASMAARLTVFIRTDGFDENAPQYTNSFTIDLPHPTAFTPELIKQAIAGLHAIYQKGFRYKKAGIILSKIIPLPVIQLDLFQEITVSKHFREMRLMMIVDALNSEEIFGRGTIFFAAQGTTRRWKMRQEHLSGHFTTRWEELLTI
jgi:DNA polymerase V